MSNITRTCIDCGAIHCDVSNKNYPAFCLTTENSHQPSLDESIEKYDEEENHRIMIHAAEVEYEFYGKMTRVEETLEFAKRMNYHKIGIATCVGLIRESRTLANIMRNHGFEVFSIACKAGAIEKTDVGIPKECQEIGINMCNPIHQALRLNHEGTDFNIVMGLCVGHDSLFYKYAKSPTTTLVTKDRVLGHNPVAALYTAHSYYHKITE